jgi:hypothetical protein
LPAEPTFETVTICRNGKPDVEIHGKLLASIDSREHTRQGEREKTRWTELQFWELADGNWLAASVACSDRTGEIDYGEIHMIERAGNDPDGAWIRNEAQARLKAMDFWQWTWLAKELAEENGWDVVERIGQPRP